MLLTPFPGADRGSVLAAQRTWVGGRMPGTATWRISRVCTITVLLVAVLVSCTNDPAPDSRSASKPSGSRAPASAPASSAEAAPEDPCSFTASGVPFPNPEAPAYSGPGPHLGVLTSAGNANDSALTMQDSGVTSLPADWQAPHNDAHVKVRQAEPFADPRKTQLVICMTAMRQTSAKTVGKCTLYEVDIPFAFEVYPAEYDFTVYEVRTGKALGSFTLNGDETAKESCPGSMNLVGNERFAQMIRQDTFADHVRRLITRTV